MDTASCLNSVAVYLPGMDSRLRVAHRGVSDALMRRLLEFISAARVFSFVRNHNAGSSGLKSDSTDAPALLDSYDSNVYVVNATRPLPFSPLHRQKWERTKGRRRRTHAPRVFDESREMRMV